MAIAAFVISLLLLGGAADPTRGWLIALVALAGAVAMRLRPWAPLRLRPALDLRLASFVLAVLLLAGTVAANRDWLIAMSVVSGLAAFMPRLIALDDHEHGQPRRRHWRQWAEWGEWGDARGRRWE